MQLELSRSHRALYSVVTALLPSLLAALPAEGTLGKDWVQASNSCPQGGVSAGAVFLDKMCLASGFASTDGVNWEQFGKPGRPWGVRAPYGDPIITCAVSDGILSIVAARQDAYWTPDGVTWIAYQGSAYNFDGMGRAVAFNGEVYVTGAFSSDDVTSYYSYVFSLRTHLARSAPWEGRVNHTSVAFNGKLWVLGGAGESQYGDVWSSADTVNWVKVCDAPWGPRAGHSTVVLDGRMWLIGGANLNDVWYSRDGANWVMMGNGPFLHRWDHASFAYRNKLWIVGGETWSRLGYQDLNDVWSSELGADDVTFSIVTNHDPLYQGGEPLDLVMTPSTPTGALTYQWYKNGQAVAGATDATYHVDHVTGAESGSYTCQVADAFQATNAAGPLAICVLDTNVSDTKAYTGDSVTYWARWGCGGVASYQWVWSDGDQDVLGMGNTDTLKIGPVNAEDAGYYWCYVAVDRMVYPTRAAALSVVDHLQIVDPPQGANVAIGSTYTFDAVTSGGFAPLTYLWRHNGQPVGTDSTYTVHVRTLQDAGLGAYTVEISDSGTDVVTSAPVALTTDVGLPVRQWAFAMAALVCAACGAFIVLRGVNKISKAK